MDCVGNKILSSNGVLWSYRVLWEIFGFRGSLFSLFWTNFIEEYAVKKAFKGVLTAVPGAHAKPPLREYITG